MKMEEQACGRRYQYLGGRRGGRASGRASGQAYKLVYGRASEQCIVIVRSSVTGRRYRGGGKGYGNLVVKTVKADAPKNRCPKG